MNFRHEMPLLSVAERRDSFDEVALGYDEQTAVAEAKRCLHCKNPLCAGGCPVKIRIPEFIAEVAKGDFAKAYDIIYSSNKLPSVTGRVCPQEVQCESKCVLGIKGEPVAIGNLERFIADWHDKQNGLNDDLSAAAGCEKNFDNAIIFNNAEKSANAKIRVAAIGSGPCGLTAAGELAERGYAVTVFEALHKGGGVLSYGIPSFRLPKSIVGSVICGLKSKGVEFVYNAVAGRSFTIEELKKWGYRSIIVCSGAGLPRFMGIDGEDLGGVCSANEYLTRINLMDAASAAAKTPVMRGGKTVVVGGGNVAMDAARAALRLGSKVTVVYRRGEKELPARRDEYLHAVEEGVEFCFMTNPTKFIGDESGRLTGAVVQKMQAGLPDASGRASPVPIKGSEYVIECDQVIMALGTSPNPLVKKAMDGVFDNRGRIKTDENGRTSLPGVFAGGDAVSGAATVILAMGAGKNAAAAADEYLKNLESDI